MKETIIIEREKVKLKDGVLITGLPGIGLVGRVVGRYLAEELNGKVVADLYSPHFPHQVFITKKGGIRLIKNKFYLVRGNGKNDILILVGDVQALSTVGQYEVGGAILDYAQKCGVKLIITVGGYSTGKIREERQIFGVVTNKDLIPRLKKAGVVFGEAKGSIVGAAGLLLGLGKLKGVDGICLMGETHGAYVDVVSAKNIVQLLSQLFNFKIDIKKLEEKAKESEKIVKKIESEIQRSIEAQHEPSKMSISYIR